MEYSRSLHFISKFIFCTLMCLLIKHEFQAYLQQELEKLHDLRNKVKLEGEHWDDLVSSSSQNSHLVSKATRLWESILARKSKSNHHPCISIIKLCHTITGFSFV